MKIVSWNLEHGRAASVWEPLARGCSTDLVFLQEATKPQSVGMARWEPIPSQSYGSAIVALNGHLEPVDDVPNYTGWVIGARWSRAIRKPSDGLFVFSIHSPTSRKGAPRRSYVREARSIVEAINSIVPRDAPLIIGGDFNFASLGQRMVDEPITMRPDELQALEAFRAQRFVVAWRALHGRGPLPQTLRWDGNKAAPYHSDGYLVRGLEGSLLACEVLEDAQTSAMSDHLPIVLEVRE